MPKRRANPRTKQNGIEKVKAKALSVCAFRNPSFSVRLIHRIIEFGVTDIIHTQRTVKRMHAHKRIMILRWKALEPNSKTHQMKQIKISVGDSE